MFFVYVGCLNDESYKKKKTSIPNELLFIYFVLCLWENAARKVRSSVIPYKKKQIILPLFP